MTEVFEKTPEEINRLCEAIEKIQEAMSAIEKTRASRALLVTLIHERSKVARRDIEFVLNNLSQIEATWLKPKPKDAKSGKAAA
jgi:hypothetical protein